MAPLAVNVGAVQLSPLPIVNGASFVPIACDSMKLIERTPLTYKRNDVPSFLSTRLCHSFWDNAAPEPIRDPPDRWLMSMKG